MEGLQIEGLSSFIGVVTPLLGKQPDAGKELVSPGSREWVQGAWGWEPSSLSSLSAGQCSFTFLLAVVFLFIQPFNQCLQTFIPLHACLLSSLLTGRMLTAEAQMAGLA